MQERTLQEKRMETFKPKKYMWEIEDLKKLSIPEIVEKYQCHKTAIYYALRKMNIRRDKYVFTENHKDNISKTHINVKGENNPNYKTGETLKEHKCIDCNASVSHVSTRCCSCHNSWKMKKLHKNPEFLRASLKGLFKRAKCSGTSKIFSGILDYFYPNRFSYVGDGTLIIDNRYTPDFYDGKKSLIEFFGVYWHKKEKSIIKDEIKLKTYKRLGYRCLVVWDIELQDLKILKQKLDCFINTIK